MCTIGCTISIAGECWMSELGELLAAGIAIQGSVVDVGWHIRRRSRT